MSGAQVLLCQGIAAGGSGAVTLNTSTPESTGAGTRTVAYRVASDRFVYAGDNAVYTVDYEWTTDSASAYEVRATQTAGHTVSGDSLATWLALSSTRTWTVQSASVDVLKYAYLTIEIRDAATATVRATGYANLYAERTS